MIKSKIKLVALVLTLILSSGLVGYWVRAQTELSFTTIIENGAMVQSYNYIIFEDSSIYYAKNGATGAIDFSGTDAFTVINASLSGLSTERTWKETVICKGSFIIGATAVDIPNYTILDLSDAKIIGGEATSTGELVAVRGTSDNLKHDIDILGGYFTDASAGYENNGIGITCATDILVKDVSGKDLDHDLVTSQTDCARVIIQNCYSLGTRRNGFYLDDSKDSQIIGCRAYNDIEKGIYVNNSPGTIIANNIVIGSQYGIQLQGANLTANGNNIKDCSRDGYRLYNAIDITIIGGISCDNLWYGLESEGTSDYYSVVGLDVRYNVIGGMNLVGSNIEIQGNIGYGDIEHNRDSGSAIIANGETVNHDLGETPTCIIITPRFTTYDGVVFVVGVIARSSTTFTVEATWVNGTMITVDNIVIDWYAEYKP